MERQFQVAPCFRDEDLRKDRRPEFIQLYLEMSFSNSESVMLLVESMLSFTCSKLQGVNPNFIRMSYEEAKLNYFTDKPDTRNGVSMPKVSEHYLYFSVDLENKERRPA